RVEWTGYLVAPETGSYRLGLGGFNGALEFDGKPLLDLGGASWNSLPTLKTVQLEAGKRYPIKVVTEARVLAGIALLWKRVVDDPLDRMRAAAAGSDVVVAVVGLTSDLEAEEAPSEVPGFKGGDKTSLDLLWKRVGDGALECVRAAAAGSEVVVDVVGLTSDLEAEEAPVEVPGFKGGDKTSMDLLVDQQALLGAARATGKPLVVVVMNGG